MTAPIITDRRPGPRRWLRGALAVITLLASAVDALVSAVTGWPRLAYVARQLARPLRDAWHHGTRTGRIPPPAVITVTAIREDTANG